MGRGEGGIRKHSDCINITRPSWRSTNYLIIKLNSLLLFPLGGPNE